MAKAMKRLAVPKPVADIPTANEPVTVLHNQPTILPDLTNPPTDTALPAEVGMSAQQGGVWASNTADKLNEDDDFGTDMIENWEAEEKVKRAPAKMLMDLRAIFEVEELRAFPVPGLKLKDMIKNDPRFGEEYATTKKDKDGVTKPSTGNRYDDLVAKLSWVQAEQKWVEYWTDVIADPSKISATDRIKYPNKAARSGQLTLHKDRVKNARTLIRNAMRVFFLMDAIQTKCPLIGCDFRMVQSMQEVEVDGKMIERPLFWTADANVTGSNPEPTFEQTKWPMREMTNSRKPIAVWSSAAASGADYQGDDYTVGGFLQFDVTECLKNGGTYDALVATAGREVEPPETALPDVKNKTRDEYLINLARYLKDANHTELLLKDIQSGKLSGAVLVAIEALRGELDVITNVPEFTSALNKERKAHDGKSTEAWLKRAS